MEVDFWKCVSLVCIIISLIGYTAGNKDGAILFAILGLYWVEVSK